MLLLNCGFFFCFIKKFYVFRLKVIYCVEFIYFNIKIDEIFKLKKSICEIIFRKDFFIV